MSRFYWSDQDLKYLSENYGKVPVKILAARLNRTVSALMNKTSQLRLGQSTTKGVIYKKHCNYCGKEFEINSKCIKYCSKECKELKQKEFSANRHNRIKDDLKEKRKIQSKKNQEVRKKLNDIKKNNEYENIKMFFKINCLNLDKSKGIKKIQEFTKREDVEIIYKNLREDFIKSNYF